MPAKSRMSIEEAKKWMGQPVCVVLKDGSYYVGYITKADHGSIYLAGQKGRTKMKRSSSSRSHRARIAGLFSGLGATGTSAAFPFNQGLGGLLGGGTGGGGLGNVGGGGLMGKFGKMWPGIRMGFGMLKTIMPLLGGFGI
ncbi:hypothetical protein [Cohnella nanjingensis]|uniref:Uncharacterized protein n=1 Tax=Cohnella nanjingensis TaxID=1387779 RepID=A0A7X0VCT1_9BACL|nr:hypothetical protein [Cohnella nanjingensis]MBB6669247.1 hypothetical protein [Cohnella nanjingensis]